MNKVIHWCRTGVKYYLKVMRNYALFRGRARRREYWFFRFLLFYFLAMMLAVVIAIAILEAISAGRITGIFLMLGLIFLTAISFHIWLLLLMTDDSHSGENKYGPNPKGIPEAG